MSAGKFHADAGDWRARDAFFTRPAVARRVWALALRHCRKAGLDPGALHWIEPSAGAGAFIKTKPACVRALTAMDIWPMGPGIAEGDFLRTGPPRDGREVAVIGNPPFGTQQGATTLFLRHAFDVWRARFSVFITSGNYPPLTRNRRRLAGIRAAAKIRLDGGGFTAAAGADYTYGCEVGARVFVAGIDNRPIPDTQHEELFVYSYGTSRGRRSPGGKTILENSLDQLAARAWVCAIKTCSPRVLSMGEFDKYKRGGGGSFIIVAPRGGMSGKVLEERIRDIDWGEVQDGVRKAGMVRGNISNRHVVAAYKRKFGGKSFRERLRTPGGGGGPMTAAIDGMAGGGVG